MMRSVLLLGAALFVGCSGDTDGDDGDGAGPTGDTGGEPTCGNLIASTFPANEADDVYYRSAIRVTLQEADATASLSLATASDGAEVSGKSEVDEKVVTFTPDAPLAPSTEYTLTVAWECGPAELTWTTSDVGAPLGDEDVVGRVYDLDLAGGEWTEPPGVGAALASFAETVEVLVSPIQVDTQISFRGGLGTGSDEQDICEPTFDLAGADFEDPFFDLTSPLLNLVIAGVEVGVEDLELSGAFAPDGTSIEGAILSGTVDTRPLVPVIAPGGKDTAVCELTAQLGVDCQPCAGNAEETFCLSLRIEDILAEEIDTDLVERTPEEITKDKRCKPQG